jgi:hypothetical protein
MLASLRPWLRAAGLHDPAAWVLLSAILLVSRLALWYAELYHFNVVDDAYISFNYTKNLLLGHGLVFNPGERVEGYTNFLWIMVLAPVFALARALQADLTTSAILTNIVIALLDLALVYLIAQRLMRASWVAVALPILLCALDNSYQGYAMSGLENHLVLLGMLGAVALWQRPSAWRWLHTGLLLAVANLARPDAGLFAACFALAFGSDLLRKRGSHGESRAARARLLGKTLLVWLALTGAWFLWRWSYYGLLLPNTFYLKVGDSFDALARGWEYTRTFFDDRLYLPLAALLALRWVGDPFVRWLLLFVLAHLGWVTFVGGDFYTGHRFYVVLLPFIYLLIGRALDGTIGWVRSMTRFSRLRRSPLAVWSLVGGLSLPAAFGLFLLTERLMDRGPYTAEVLRWAGPVNANVRYMRWLGTWAPPGSSMVVGDIGAAGFLGHVSVVDCLGVVDPTVARTKVPGFGKGKPGHEKWASREYMLSKHPTLIKWNWIQGDLTALGYYVFTDFPRGIEVEGLWVKDELTSEQLLHDTAVHFEPSEVAFWAPSGDAFASFPTTSLVHGQVGVFGHAGSYINTFTADAGDRATGRLLSPPFPLVGDKMLLRVGGGRDLDRLRVSLLVDGRIVRSATGHNREILGRRSWDIAPFKGQQGRLEIVDQLQGNWAHLLVDEIVQTRD